MLSVLYGRSVVEERIAEAQGNRGLRQYYALEFRGGIPPTAIPVRWTTRRYRALASLRGLVRRAMKRSRGAAGPPLRTTGD